MKTTICATIEQKQAETVRLMARAEGRTVSSIVRDSLGAYIETSSKNRTLGAEAEND